MSRGSPTRPEPATLARLHATMARIRRFEELTAELWWSGRISGELHSSVGEEGVAAGVLDHLTDRDAVAIDHRSTGPMLARGVPPRAVLDELLGSEDGLCRGWGGHMHLMSRDHLAVSDGIVGAAGPLACGFALAAVRDRMGAVAVAFFGEGATNQGMLLESFNLAVAWRLPVLFVCKDSRWAITTRSRDVSGGRLRTRARAFGLRTTHARGWDAAAVWAATASLLPGVRAGRPAFLHVDVRRPEGHLLDDPFLRPLREPATQAREMGAPMVAALRRPGTDAGGAARGLADLGRRLTLLAVGRIPDRDPLRTGRRQLGDATARRIEARSVAELDAALAEGAIP